MPRVEKECPRCKGERGFWMVFKAGVAFRSDKPKGIWQPCITCKSQGRVKVASMAEFRRLERSIRKPQKVGTKQREKKRS
jgi:hypothetical protein